MDLTTLLIETIELYVEYVEVHGYDPERAKHAAVSDALDGLREESDGPAGDVTLSGNYTSPEAVNRALRHAAQQDPAYCHHCNDGSYGRDIRDCGSAGLEYRCDGCGQTWIA